MNLAGQRVLLTGATGGLGSAIARRMAAAGADLLLTGRRVDVLEPLAAELGAQFLAADLADRTAVGRLVVAAREVDVLVANAAVPASGRLVTYSAEQIDRALDVNLRAPIVLAHALTPGMVARGRGHVVFVSSIAGKTASGGTSLYNATKYGLRGLSLALRAELRTHGVGVSAIFPGFIRDAGMFADTAIKLPPGTGTRRPEQVAAAVVRAVEHDKAEIDVAPLLLRVGAVLGGIVPELVERASRIGGAEDIALEFERAQIHKR
ncbi:MAG: SDR family NAD(P)-dependent oxidoreductase [Solirubrobacteraceae bacterium]